LRPRARVRGRRHRCCRLSSAARSPDPAAGEGLVGTGQAEGGNGRLVDDVQLDRDVTGRAQVQVVSGAGVRDRRVRDSVVLQSLLPAPQLRDALDGEREVVQAAPPLVEPAARRAVVVGW
jgi:hypothetical protein